MMLFNKLALHNVFNGQGNFGTSKLRAAVDAQTNEQSKGLTLFLRFRAEELVSLPDKQVTQLLFNILIISD